AVLTATSSTAQAGKGGKKKAYQRVQGVVEETTKDKDKDTGTISILVHAKKNAQPAAPAAPAPAAKEMKFQISTDTKFEIVVGKKGDREVKPAAFSDVHKGEHVVIIAKTGQSHVAEKVIIVKHKKN